MSEGLGQHALTAALAPGQLMTTLEPAPHAGMALLAMGGKNSARRSLPKDDLEMKKQRLKPAAAPRPPGPASPPDLAAEQQLAHAPPGPKDTAPAGVIREPTRGQASHMHLSTTPGAGASTSVSQRRG
uniref:Uncharacterized protein n=1 Tax=Knipowitschia caucasica TaxID=637954 RepID=A0AAV2IXM2_KNICA